MATCKIVRPDFDALKDLHDSANDLLDSPTIRNTITDQGQEKVVRDISEASLRILNSCGNTKDVLLLVKDHLQDLQSAFRRESIRETNRLPVDNKFSGFIVQRKELKKTMLKRLQSLKGMNNKYCTSDVSSINQNLAIVIDVLKEVRMTTVCIVESLTSLMSIPSPDQKCNKGFFGSKLIRVNSLSSWEKCDKAMLQGASKRLKTVKITIEELEAELECIFRRLIQTRVSLLNILTK